MGNVPAYSSAEFAARENYGRLVALLSARSGDISSAEDALGDALMVALQRWPSEGVPKNPAAWLLTVARRRGIDAARKRARATLLQPELLRISEESEALISEHRPFPDYRLGLLLACAHPAIDESARTPLMLQAVLGLSAEQMASAFLTSPAAMTKRLVRAKAKLASSGVRFTHPDAETLPERLPPLLDAIYAAFTLAQDGDDGADLRTEALWLGRLVAELLPDEPETLGLLCLMLFVSARVPANNGDTFIPLSLQDTRKWNEQVIAEAESLLRVAGTAGRPGRFQIEAAIQAVHVARRRTGETDWSAIVSLYAGLLDVAPTIGAEVALAAALVQAGRKLDALVRLDAIDLRRVSSHQPYWATRAFVLAELKHFVEAQQAYDRAAGLTESQRIRAWLREQRHALPI